MRVLLSFVLAILLLGETAVAQSPAPLPAAASCLQAGETADQWQTVEICTKAIGADRPLRPGFGSAYFARGRALALVGERDRSLADLDIAIMLDPQNGDAYYWRAVVLKEMGRSEEALTAVGHAGSCATSTAMRARAATLQGALRGGADDSLGALLRGYYLTRAAISQYNRDPQAAERYLARLALGGANSRSLSDAYYEVGGLYMNIADPASALRAYENAIACAPFDPKLHSARLYGNYLLGRLDLALADAEIVLARSPQHAWALSDRCLLKMLTGHYEEALANCEAALRVHNTARIATLVNRGVTLFHLGRFPESRASFNEALSIQPGYAYALYGRGVLKLREGDNDGHADIADAKRIFPRVEGEYRRWKMMP